jgi:hypothetical protein
MRPAFCSTLSLASPKDCHELFGGKKAPKQFINTAFLTVFALS